MSVGHPTNAAILNLSNLLSNLKRHIRMHQAKFYYTREADEFLRHMLDAIRCTQTYLDNVQARLRRHVRGDIELDILSTNLGMLSEDWKTLHQFIKPVTDADLLHIPVPLVDLLNRQASKVSSLANCRTVVSHGVSLGYFKRAHVSIQIAIDSLGRLFEPAGIPNPQFPKKLGLIVLPFTSAKQLFQNTILYHELGEFVYDESIVATELQLELNRLETETTAVGASLKKMTVPEKRRVVSWCRELFCDLFAVHLIGPVFPFASAEYCELANDKHEHWASTHPPDDIRLDEQIEILKTQECGWWVHLLQEHKDTCSFLEQFVASRKDERVDWEKKTGATENSPGEASAVSNRFRLLVAVFDSLKPVVRTLASNQSEGLHSSRPSSELWRRILTCLAHGIVPSAVLLKDNTEEVSPVTMINAGYFFGREKLDDLIVNTCDRNSENLTDRAWLLSRVEEWTLKGVDDILNWIEPEPKINLPGDDGTGSFGGILPWKPIRRAWKQREPKETDTVVITPVKWDGFDADAIDLRLGAQFVLSRPHSIASVDFKKNKDGPEVDPLELLRSQELVHIPKGEPIVIPPHGTILGVTLEFIKLPYNASGEVLTKSSLARRFVTIETAPWIHPLYRGCLTLEIANSSDVAVRLRVGDAIAQLVLFSIAHAECPSQDRIDKYAGPTYPELEPGQDS
jgi:dCTP deaminase